jgi:hypothetical protein
MSLIKNKNPHNSVLSYYEQNQSEVDQLWEDYLENIWVSDSYSHYQYVRDSDICFLEFVMDLMPDNIGLELE